MPQFPLVSLVRKRFDLLPNEKREFLFSHILEIEIIGLSKSYFLICPLPLQIAEKHNLP